MILMRDFFTIRLVNFSWGGGGWVGYPDTPPPLPPLTLLCALAQPPVTLTIFASLDSSVKPHNLIRL